MGDYDLQQSDRQDSRYQVQAEDGTTLAPGGVMSGFGKSPSDSGGFPPRPPAGPPRKNPASPYSYAPAPSTETVDSIATQPAQTATFQGTLLDPFRGARGEQRVETVRSSLTDAVDTWWTASELPPDSLLRDGLLALQAGYDLNEPQKTLLARSALSRGRGIFTALAYLGDAERMATLVHEALLNGAFGPEDLPLLGQARLYDGTWISFLVQELRADLVSPDPTTVDRAQRALAVLTGTPSVVTGTERGVLTLDAGVARRPWLRWLAAIAMILALAALWLLQGRGADYGDVVTVPAGTYSITDEDGSTFAAEMGAFVIDRTEVTNKAYRDCFERWQCPWPEAIQTEAERDHFRNEAFAAYPAANLTWEEAKAYCESRSMRLPTTGEWEVAARYAPATGRYYMWPWGNVYQAEFVQAGADSQGVSAVGARSPQGDSPLGLADMAGNVAEWTGSSVPDAPALAYVKGGAWFDQPEDLAAAALSRQDKSQAQPWLGFRCAATP